VVSLPLTANSDAYGLPILEGDDERVQLGFSTLSVAAALAFGVPQLLAQSQPTNATGQC